jgi:hypothetical protein
MPPGPVSLLFDVVAQLTLLLLFGLGLGLWTTRRLRLPPIFVPAVVFASACLQAYLLFFVWFFSPRAGTQLTRAVLAASVAWALYLLRPLESVRPRREPLLAIGQMLLVAYGFLLVLTAVPVPAAQRFSFSLPIDDSLPRFLADRFSFGLFQWVTPQPSLGGHYQASDRPPLQAAVVVIVRALLPIDREATYQVAGTLCQTGWVLALYALSATYRLRRGQRAVVLIATACSGFALLNSVYVWPKLMAAWLFVAALAVIFYDDEPSQRPTSGRLACASALTALSLLAHGGTAFSLVAAPSLLLERRSRSYLRPKALLAAGFVGLAILSPWLAYQKILDPPGDRLVKIHLAGVDAIDPRSAATVIWERYTSATIGELVSARLSNLSHQWLTRSGRTEVAPWLQWQQFFHIIPALGPLCVGLFALLLRRRPTPDEAGARSLLLYALVTWALWILLIFSPDNALLHHSSYANLLLLFFLGSLGLTFLPHAVSGLLLALQVAVFVVGWLQPFGLPAGTRHGWLALGALALGVFALLACVAPSEPSLDLRPEDRRG